MKTKRIAILQSNYIPWKGYFDLINSVDVFVIYDEVQYTKNDWRNRNIIKTRNGTEWITIPVRQLSLNQRIDESRITLKNWNVKHWSSIKTNYAKAKCFNEVKEFVENLYLSRPKTDMLSAINKHFILEICQFLGVQTKIIDSSELRLQGDRNERLIDACSKLNGTIYVSGPSAKGYLDVSSFEQSKIGIEWMDYSGYKEYAQLFPPFEHRVSIIDVILNTGLLAKNYIKKLEHET